MPVYRSVGVQRKAIGDGQAAASARWSVGQRQPLLNGLLLQHLVLVVSPVSLGLAQHSVQHAGDVVVTGWPQRHHLPVGLPQFSRRLKPEPPR
jgi:hypothetical protein